MWMWTRVQLGTRAEVGRGEKAELAAIGRKRREKEAKERGREVGEDVVKDFRL